MALVFDIESNGFMPEVNHIWLIMTQDTVTGEKCQFSDDDPDLPPLKDGLKKLSESKFLVGHNIIGYDLPVLKHLMGWEPTTGTQIYDTWVMSQVLRTKRGHLHGLEGWGSFFSYPKFKFDDFSKYSKEMLTYGIRDVELNVKVFEKVVEETKKTIALNPLFKLGLQVEFEFADLEQLIRHYGWNFDHKEAHRLLAEMQAKMEAIEEEVNPQIGLVCVKRDAIKDFKKPLFKKNGEYASSTCKYFGIDPSSGCDPLTRLVDGPYSRIAFEQGRLSSDKVLKTWLYSIGWEPDEWNVEKVGRQFVQKSPKLTESSLSLLGPVGLKISEYGSISNRAGILKGWLKEVEYDGRLHGRMWTIGTPTFRCRHQVVANLPTADDETIYGKEMRSLLLPRPGWVIVGADSAGNQMRGLCHYIGNQEFTDEVINGDVHTRNALVLKPYMPSSLDDKGRRKRAKPFLYAFLFGAGGEKASLILQGKRDMSLGKEAMEHFTNSIPGLKEIKDKLIAQWETTKNRFGEENAFIRGIDGRIIFVKSKHQLLNYLLQTLEGITCKAAAVYARRELLKAGIQHNFLLHYHDEMAIECHPDDAERVAAICVEAFTEAPKWFGVTCMNGAAKIGVNYAAVH